jgi:DNA excision repair protein ERCC-2
VLLEDTFPYPAFRQGQKELAQSIYLACKNGNTLVAEAMSGFGKTAAVLAGSLLAAAEDDLKIVYVCRTKRQVFRAMEELERFSKRLPVRAASLFSKYDYCLQRERSFGVSPETFKWYCSFQTSNNLCSYFLNVPFNHKAIQRLVDDQIGSKPISDLMESGKTLHVCPYEVERILLARARIIVTTYHYLLDQASRSVLLTGAFQSPSKVVAVVDEAHNVRDFISSNSTITLAFSDIEQCAKDSRNLYLDKVGSAISEINDRVKRLCPDDGHWLVDKGAFVKELSERHPREWLSNLAFELSTNSGVAWYSVATGRNMPSSIIRFGSFLSNLLSSLDSDEISLVKSDRALFLTDTDPSKRFLGATAGLRSLILLSATINPSNLFLRSIGLDDSTIVHSAVTSYKFRVKTVIDTDVSTRFKLRTTEMYSRIAQKIIAVCESTSGGVGIFAPSYGILESIRGLLLTQIEGKGARTIVVEKSGLTNEDSEEMMKTFKSNHGSLLLAVQGGRFSEGEDFPGDNMDVSIVVGLAIPPPSPITYAGYRQLEKSHLDRHEAHLVLSLLPALRKAFQCAGRHIRNPGKVGMVFFLDSRFAEQKVTILMPSWLKEDIVKGNYSPEEIGIITRDFFSSARSP